MDNSLYDNLKLALRCIEICAIYKPDERGMFCAAIDLTETGKTYRVFFGLDENGLPDIVKMERWFLG